MLGNEPIYLVGYMGSGKSTVGRYLADILGFRFIDTDFFIENRFRQRVQDMFASVGEEVFRRREKVVIEELSGMTNAVIATGGGLPCFHNNMQLMNDTGITVYLKVTNEILAKRLELCGGTRPSVKGKKGDVLLHHVVEAMAVRAPIYDTAKLVAPADTLMTDSDERRLATQIAAELRIYANKEPQQ
ncbi:shikimate kinase [Porphyromonas crevioricanis]|uniref:shikimate kinase n=1 Tax=Porphyromonas crevioricanis TaxID=393921 RepID=UPI0005A8D210|nr:shikimate kinase [Porphyromonas crevioricanis]SJZ95717.1 shikimate kinase [Porphyromonas crevioricanis]